MSLCSCTLGFLFLITKIITAIIIKRATIAIITKAIAHFLEYSFFLEYCFGLDSSYYHSSVFLKFNFSFSFSKLTSIILLVFSNDKHILEVSKINKSDIFNEIHPKISFTYLLYLK